MHKEIPVLLLTGYLGSGKTTLLNRILTNQRGIRFAVIVNDIGQVNIDAELIQKGGIVGTKDESLVALQNGCICCTLRTDLVEQVFELMKTERFDYIVIEASGICEPEPIAQTICSIPRMGGAYVRYGVCRMDSIITVVDALRIKSEFACGHRLAQQNLAEEDIENLLIQQIEFCDLILLNKVSEITPEEKEQVVKILHTLQPQAEIVECDYADIEMDKILHTHRFDYQKVATSAGWIKGIEKPLEACDTCADSNIHHEHQHHHDHHAEHHEHHHHADSEVEEYGIGTFVYYRRPAFDIHKFDRFIATQWPTNIIRAKGICYFSHNRDMSFLFEQAGCQKQLTESGLWYATAPEEDIVSLMQKEPGLLRDWDKTYGDRMQKLVFIGRNLDKEQLISRLDACLEEQ